MFEQIERSRYAVLALAAHLGAGARTSSTCSAGPLLNRWGRWGLLPPDMEEEPRLVTDGRTRLLIIDDDQQALSLLKTFLETQGYAVTTATEGWQALRRLDRDGPDLVILDILMPGMSGWDVCARIREVSDVPIIVLTALGDQTDRVKGLGMGADDYVVKPFGLRELAARVEAVLRRTRHGERSGGAQVLYADDYLVIDADRAEVRCGGERVRLTAVELKLLLLMARNRGRLLSPSQILNNVWGPEYADETNYVRLYVWRLRQKIEPVPEEPRYIVTEHGLGYRFVVNA